MEWRRIRELQGQGIQVGIVARSLWVQLPATPGHQQNSFENARGAQPSKTLNLPQWLTLLDAFQKNACNSQHLPNVVEVMQESNLLESVAFVKCNGCGVIVYDVEVYAETAPFLCLFQDACQ